MRLSVLLWKFTGKKLPEVREFRRYYGFFLPYLVKYWKSYLLLTLFMLVSVATTLGYAWFLKGITQAAVDHSFRRVGWLLIFGVAQFALDITVGFYDGYLRSVTMNKLKMDLRNHLFGHVMHLSSRFFADHHSGDLLSRLTNDVDSAVGGVGANLINLIRLPLTAVAAFIYLYGMNKQMSLLILLLGPVVLVSAVLFSKYLRLNGQRIQSQLGKVNSLLSESLAGTMVIRSFALEGHFSNRFRKDTEYLLSLQTKDAKLGGGFRVGARTGSTIALLLCLGLGAYNVANGRMPIGSLMAFISLMQHLVSPFTGMARHFSGLQRSLAATERIWQVLDAVDETPTSVVRRHARRRRTSFPRVSVKEPHSDESLILQGPGLASQVPSIHFSQVSFSYDGHQNALDNFSLTVPAGNVIAVVGPSGAGKSTLFHLTLGFYPPNSGTVYLAGEPYERLGSATLRSQIAYVPQETFLFSGTVRDNLRYGRLDATDADILRAARDANLHDFILSLPNGFDTEIGERGVRLSGGQKQRISIARAILKDAPILLLDEATSALDSETEHLVQEALDRLMENRTTMIIAHRLSTIRHADSILVMEQGRLVEQGGHEELLMKNGTYARLYRLQFPKDNLYVI